MTDRSVCTVRAGVAGDHTEALGRALEGGCEWLWLLDRGAAPQPRALEELLASSEGWGALGAPVLLASRVAAADGSLDRRSLPVVEVFEADLTLAALERRLLALRAARPGSLLVHRRAFEGRPLPRLESVFDYLEWTAHLLKAERGLLAPASIVERAEEAGRGPERMELRSRLRFVSGAALEPRERPWFAFHVVEEAWAAARRECRARRPGRSRRSGS